MLHEHLSPIKGFCFWAAFDGTGVPGTSANSPTVANGKWQAFLLVIYAVIHLRFDNVTIITESAWRNSVENQQTVI